MSSFLANGARGDWRNFKGDHYHIVYLVWSLLHEPGKIAFYQGNDLLRQAPLPAQIGTGATTTPLTMLSQKADQDEWIQLKAVQGANWSCTAIFRDLLANFLFNALLSRLNNRVWSVKLVTPSTINAADITAFVTEYTKTALHRTRRRDFKKVVKDVVTKWNAENPQHQVAATDAEQLGLEVLRQLATQTPFSLDVLKLQCENTLLPLHSNTNKVIRILNTVSGALLGEASKGPSAARFYALEWLEQEAGESLQDKELLAKDPQAACEEASRNFLPRDWNPDYFTPRVELQGALQEFLAAPESVFCLIGLSGTGKSWTTAWVMSQCQDHLPLLLSAGELDLYPTVPDLVASRLKSYTSVENSNETLLKRWTAASSLRKAPVLILDDLLVLGVDAPQLKNQLKRLGDQAKQYGIKLILTCQAQIWRINKLGDGLGLQDVFSLLTEQDDSISLPEEDDAQENSTEPARDDFDEMERAQKNKAWQRRTLKTQRVSFVLEDFNPDELEDAVKRRLDNLPESRRDQIAFQLRSPAFAALRSPYLLAQYLGQEGTKLVSSTEPPPLNVDSLLDTRVQSALDRVAEHMGCDVSDLRGAFDFLVAQLWDNRSQGVDAFRMGQGIQQNSGLEGSRFIRELRLVALLTPQTPLLLERTPVAERLFALELEKRVANGRALLDELRLEEDGGVVTAYLRHLCARTPEPILAVDAPAQSNAFNAVSVAEKLLAEDRRWLRPICDGLAQASPDDVRVVSFLATAMRPPGEEGGIEHQACRALGRLAARGGEALRWVAAMYLSGSFHERTWGALALSELLEFDPRLVGKIVARRLSYAAQIDCFAFKGRDRRDNWLRWALDPLNHPRHHESARVVKKVAASYAELVTHYGSREYRDEQGNRVRRSLFEHQFDWKFAEDLADVRGGLIAWDEAEREQALRDLSSDVRQDRLMAALAMRPASFSALDAIADALLARLRVETDGVILSRLLWASNGLTRPRYAARLLEALREGQVNRWDDRLVCGPVLGLLARLAPRDAQGVFEFLPRRLDRLSQPEAMYLHEALAYAWWSLAGQSKQLPLSLREFPWQHLQELSQLPDDVVKEAEVEVEFKEQMGNRSNTDDASEQLQSRLTPRDGWTFWAKGVALARLALLGRDRIGAVESQFHEMGNWWPYYFAEVEDLTAKHIRFLRDQPGFSGLQEALLVAARAHVSLALMHVHSFDSEQDIFKRMGFHAARQCLTSLAIILAHSPSALQGVEAVTRSQSGDWEQIFLVRSLLERGNRDPEIVQLAEQMCDELGRSFTANGAAERERTLAILTAIRAGAGQQDALERYREQTKESFLGYNDRAGGLAQLTDFHPERLLELLDQNVQHLDDLLTLFLWHREARDWRALLLAKVFARMFDPRPIRRSEAEQLCRWILTSVQALPDSPLRQQWQTTYGAIYSVLTTNFSPGGKLSGEDTPLQNSHLQAVTVLNEATGQGKITHDWLDTYFEPSSLLLQAHTFSVEDTQVSHSLFGSADTLFCFPAMRLLGVALDKGRFHVDPVGRRMQEREKLPAFRKKHGLFFHDPARPQLEQNQKDAVVKDYEKLLATRKEENAPRDDVFLIQHLTILLLADQPQRAEDMAERYGAEFSTLPFVAKETLYSFWYDLACAQARLAKEDAARASLLKAAEYGSLNGQHMTEDTDLDSLRDKTWFQELLAQLPPPSTTRTAHMKIFPLVTVTDVDLKENGQYTISFSFDGNVGHARPSSTSQQGVSSGISSI